jgi:hypothetical protein
MRRPARAGAGEDPESLRDRIEADIVPSFGSGPPELARAVRYWKNALQALSSSSCRSRSTRSSFLLGRSFGYPDVLRSPTGDILGRFQAGGVSLKLLWYGFVLTALAARGACRDRGPAARFRERVTGIPIGHPRTSALRAMTASSGSSAKSAIASLPSGV